MDLHELMLQHWSFGLYKRVIFCLPAFKAPPSHFDTNDVFSDIFLFSCLLFTGHGIQTSDLPVQGSNAVTVMLTAPRNCNNCFMFIIFRLGQKKILRCSTGIQSGSYLITDKNNETPQTLQAQGRYNSSCWLYFLTLYQLSFTLATFLNLDNHFYDAKMILLTLFLQLECWNLFYTQLKKRVLNKACLKWWILSIRRYTLLITVASWLL